MFWSKPFVSKEISDWVIESFDWFDARFKAPPMPILPTKDFFKAGRGEDHETAKAVVTDLTRLLDYRHSLRLYPLNALPEEFRHSYQSLSQTAGTFQIDADGPVICYDPALLKQPLGFINTMAHELMHARLSGIEDLVPGGAEAHELATDLGCIIAGFGVFQLQAADDSGWSGYLSQQTRGFAMAYFLEQRGLGVDAVDTYLSPRCRKLIVKGMHALKAL